MNNHADFLFKDETRISARAVLVVVMVTGCLAALSGQGAGLAWEVLDKVLTLFLITMYLSLLAWWLEGHHQRLGRWLTFIDMTIIIFLTSTWFQIPEILVLEAFPLALMAGMVNFPEAVLAAGLESVILTGLRLGKLVDLPPTGLAITILALWLMLVVLWLLFHPTKELSRWLGEYFTQMQQYLLEARVRKGEQERTLESLENANRQLVLANKKMAMLSAIAEEAQKAKAAFVANVSHEFRTPLNMIIGLIDLIGRSPEIYDVVLSPKLRDDLAVINRNCEHLSNMINDVLDLTRIETGRLALYRDWIDLEETIKKSVAVVRPLLNQKHLSINLSFAAELPKVYCDRVRIQQVILNLLSNAARFTENGGVTIRVSREGASVLVEVSDSGPGISPDDAVKIFEPFWQGKAPIWQKKGGSGLGLSLSREFIQLHGGKMWFNSQPGQGTSFFYTLPCKPIEEPSSSVGRFIKEDWLWVEDSFKLSQMSATGEGVKPQIIIYDPAKVLQSRFQRCSNQIDFVDVPEISYLEKGNLAQAVVVNGKSPEELIGVVEPLLDKLPTTPFIGCQVEREIQRALDLGAAGYLIKPVVYQTLVKTIDAMAEPVRQILVVDDDPQVQQLFRRMLIAYKPTLMVQTASSGLEALALILQTTPDLLLLDLVMPEMSGWEVLEALNKLDLPRRPQTLFISAQDPADQIGSSYLFLTIKGGIPIDKLCQLTVGISRLLTGLGPEPDPMPG